MDSTADEWELCNDDGFIYKRKKRRLDDPPAVHGPDPQAEEWERKQRKRKALLKLKKQYQKEIDQWEYLSNTLRAMQEKSQQQQQQQQQQRPQDLEETASILGSASKLVQDNEIGCCSLVDELLLQAEAQEAIIQDISNLCDVAEAMCSAQEEQLKQSFFDLPVWSSPHELMGSLCDKD